MIKIPLLTPFSLFTDVDTEETYLLLVSRRIVGEVSIVGTNNFNVDTLLKTGSFSSVEDFLFIYTYT